VLHLWTANFHARRRAKALLNGIRAARFHADAIAADLSAMETELDLARAAYDSHVGNDNRLERELAECRQHEQLVAPLSDEVATLRSELEYAREKVARQTVEYEKLATELNSLQHAERETTASAADDKRAEQLEVQVAAQASELELLKQELQTAQLEHQRLTELYQAEAERVARLEGAAAEQLSALAAAQDSDCRAKSSDRLPPAWTQLAEPASDVWNVVQSPRSNEPAYKTASSTSEAVAWGQPPALISEATAPARSEPVQSADSTIGLVATSSETEDEPLVETTALSPQSDASRSVAELVEAVREAPVEKRGFTLAAPADEQKASEYSSPSFIDKYRYLLEQESELEPAGAVCGGRPTLEDEYLSPAKAETFASPPDDSDEALEAYMAKMMQRVRSNSTAFDESKQAPVEHEPAPSMIARLPQPTDEPAQKNAIIATPDFLAEVPLSFEDLKNATRKTPLASDLAALREIANSTARKAIATHTRRRSRESAITKMIVAVTALVSAAYLMASAPQLDNWLFWAGAGSCGVGIVAAVQVLLLERRGHG
jgi:hypothetical protein